jgi:hypothetical protein
MRAALTFGFAVLLISLIIGILILLSGALAQSWPVFTTGFVMMALAIIGLALGPRESWEREDDEW